MAESTETTDQDPLKIWLSGITSENTRTAYAFWLGKLLQLMHLNSIELLERAQRDVVKLWNDAKAASLKLKPSGHRLALNALRTFLRSNGKYPPNDRIEGPKKKAPIKLKWSEVLAITRVARPPYNNIFKLMLHCGWGIEQFLDFNTEPTWHKIKISFTQPDTPEYFQYTFGSRKQNELPYYTLIPGFLLTEIIQSKTVLPFRTGRGGMLGMIDYRQYKNSSAYLEREWRAARRRAGREEMKLHNLRGAFKTKSTTSDTRVEAAEFAIGHQVDKLGYDRCWGDEAWVWSELSKIYKVAAID